MRFVFDGMLKDVASFKLFKAADASAINIRLVADDGGVVDMTTGTATLEIYTTVDRRATAVASLALTVAAATAGHLTYTPTIANVNYGPGAYYAYVKHVVGSTTTITKNYVKLNIG